MTTSLPPLHGRALGEATAGPSCTRCFVTDRELTSIHAPCGCVPMLCDACLRFGRDVWLAVYGEACDGEHFDYASVWARSGAFCTGHLCGPVGHGIDQDPFARESRCSRARPVRGHRRG